MNRTPPRDVLRTLRREVGFGCPFPGCREAILTWHHFDPPWRVEQHHRPEGMIALCLQHASAADRGLYSSSQLRQLKSSAGAAEDVRTHLPWATKDFLIRLGGCYSGGESVPLVVGGTPVISLNRDANGLLLFSIELRSPDGTLLASVQENFFEADPTQLHDLTLDTAPTHVKIWFSGRDIGMELSFRRTTLEELDEVLAKDRERANRTLEKYLPPEVNELMSRGESCLETMRGTLSSSNLPVHIREAFLSGDPTGWAVREYAKRHQDEEGKVAFLDFRKLHIHSNGRELVVQDGMGSFMQYSASFGNGQGGFNL